jgi:hypothetical protein
VPNQIVELEVWLWIGEANLRALPWHRAQRFRGPRVHWKYHREIASSRDDRIEHRGKILLFIDIGGPVECQHDVLPAVCSPSSSQHAGFRRRSTLASRESIIVFPTKQIWPDNAMRGWTALAGLVQPRAFCRTVPKKRKPP